MKLEDEKISMSFMDTWIYDRLRSVNGEVSESCPGMNKPTFLGKRRTGYELGIFGKVL